MTRLIAVSYRGGDPMPVRSHWAWAPRSEDEGRQWPWSFNEWDELEEFLRDESPIFLELLIKYQGDPEIAHRTDPDRWPEFR